MSIRVLANFMEPTMKSWSSQAHLPWSQPVASRRSMDSPQEYSITWDTSRTGRHLVMTALVLCRVGRESCQVLPLDALMGKVVRIDVHIDANNPPGGDGRRQPDGQANRSYREQHLTQEWTSNCVFTLFRFSSTES